MTLEQRLGKHNKRLTTALTLMAVAMCAVVTVAAKYRVEKEGLFEVVATRHINVMNDAGKVVVALSANDDGYGMIRTKSAKGKEMVELTSSDSGGLINVYNKTGETIKKMQTDEYGNGLVGAWNRKGKWRTLKPGP